MVMKEVLVVFALAAYASAAYSCAKGITILDDVMTDDDRKAIRLLHNRYRSAIVDGTVSGLPKGYKIYRMDYNLAVEEQAKLVTNTCEDDHVDGFINGTKLGQNIYWSSSSQLNTTHIWEAAFTKWIGELVNYKYPVEYNGGKETRHLTQVIWAMTSQLGCRFVHYDDPSKQFRYQKLYACNYNVRGNMQGEAPYNNKQT